MAEATSEPSSPSATPHPGPKTLDQHRAKFAWDKVRALKGKPAKDLDEYRDLVRKLPAMIQTNGLGQALAFLLVQKGNKRALYNHLQDWLCRPPQRTIAAIYPPAQGDTPSSPFLLIQRLTACDSRLLRHATVEALALAQWLKRFAEAREIEAASRTAAPPLDSAPAAVETQAVSPSAAPQGG